MMLASIGQDEVLVRNPQDPNVIDRVLTPFRVVLSRTGQWLLDYVLPDSVEGALKGYAGATYSSIATKLGVVFWILVLLLTLFVGRYVELAFRARWWIIGGLAAFLLYRWLS